MTTYWLRGYGSRHPILNDHFITTTKNTCDKLLRTLSPPTPAADFVCNDSKPTADSLHRPDTTTSCTTQCAQSYDVTPHESRDAEKPVVLLIDDSVVTLRVTAAKLEGSGYEAITAINGVEALRTYQETVAAKRVISLILLDDDMPLMDGCITALALRSAGYQGCIIGLTAKISQGFKQEVSYCLPKPLSIETLQRLVSPQTT